MCKYIACSESFVIKSNGSNGNWTQVDGPNTNSMPMNQPCLTLPVEIKSQKTPRSAVGVEPTAFHVAATDDEAGASTETATMTCKSRETMTFDVLYEATLGGISRWAYAHLEYL